MFKGSDAVERLSNGQFSHPSLSSPLSGEEAVALCSAMLRAKLFHGAVPAKRGREDELDILSPVWDRPSFGGGEDDVYVWVLEPSRTRLLVQGVALIAFAIFACCIKIWPLWLKIFVWWCSVVLLVTMLSVLSVRIVLAMAFWLVGLRGLWLLPNLLDDDADLWETLTPVFGYGRKSKQAAQKKKEAAAAAAAGAGATAASSSWKSSLFSDTGGKYDFQFGLINLSLLILAGLLLCRHLGVFQGENIPDFVISQRELHHHFPALSSPEAAAALEKELQAEAEAAAAAAEKQGEASLYEEEQGGDREAEADEYEEDEGEEEGDDE